MGRSQGVRGSGAGYDCCVGNVVEEREGVKGVTEYTDAGWTTWLVNEDDRTRTLLERVEV